MSRPTGLNVIATPPLALGLNRQTLTRIEPVDGRMFATGAVVIADSAMMTHFRVSVPFPATAMEYLPAVSAGNVDLGIFSTPDFTNFTMLTHTGATLAVGTLNVHSINLLTNVQLVPGIDYYAAIVGNNATLSIARLAGFQTLLFASRSCYSKAALDPLASFVTPQNGSVVPWLAIK